MQSKMAASPPVTPERFSAGTSPINRASSVHSGGNSPDSSCPICLGQVNNKAFTDACFHTFCFVCLLEWSKIKATCPLCKTSFKSIIHNVVSNDVYEQYHLKPASNGSFGTDDRGRRFRYSTTLTEEHRIELTWRRNQAQERRYRHAHGLQLQIAAEERRRMIYRAGLWAKHIGSNHLTRFRDISPEFFRQNPAVLHRLVPWLRRDLGILFNGEDHVTFMSQYILSLIPNVHMQTEDFHDQLRPFLYDQTEHFIHEFVSFARSPYDINTYDQIVQYDITASQTRPQQLTTQPLASLSTGHNNVITLSSDDEVIEVPTLSSLLRSENNSPEVGAQDLSATHNPEPPFIHNDPDEPGPSGVSNNHAIQVKPEPMSIISDEGNNSDIEILAVINPCSECLVISSDTELDEDRKNMQQTPTKQGGKCRRKRKHLSDHLTTHSSDAEPKQSSHHQHSHKTSRTKRQQQDKQNDNNVHSKRKRSKSRRHHKRSRSRSKSSSHHHTSKIKSRHGHNGLTEESLPKVHQRSPSHSNTSFQSSTKDNRNVSRRTPQSDRQKSDLDQGSELRRKSSSSAEDSWKPYYHGYERRAQPRKITNETSISDDIRNDKLTHSKAPNSDMEHKADLRSTEESHSSLVPLTSKMDGDRNGHHGHHRHKHKKHHRHKSRKNKKRSHECCGLGNLSNDGDKSSSSTEEDTTQYKL